MRNDKISVIIAIYNVAEYLEQCLESVRHQTYKNLEIICVDDGSVDGSAEICDRYAVADSRFIVIHKENGGECSARNFGLNICSGSYISFIDGDDWLEPRMYERLLELILQDEKIGISMCGHSMDYEDRTVMMINNKKVPEKIVSPMREFLYYIYRRDEYKNVTNYLWAKLFRAEYFTGNKGIRFPIDLTVGHDVVVGALCYLRTEYVIYTDSALYHYRQRQGSVMHNLDRRLKGLGSCVAYERVINLYKKNGISFKILKYVERFYVYHASVLLKMAYQVGDAESVMALKTKIKKYLLVYILTNLDHPDRIIDMIRNLIRKD